MAKYPTGQANPKWKGGRHINHYGYVMRNVGFGNGTTGLHREYLQEHRWVMQQLLGRKLKSKEHVHHINGDKTDNRPENLEVLLSSDHLKKEHSLGKRDYSRGIAAIVSHAFARRSPVFFNRWTRTWQERRNYVEI